MTTIGTAAFVAVCRSKLLCSFDKIGDAVGNSQDPLLDTGFILDLDAPSCDNTVSFLSCPNDIGWTD